MSDAVGAKANDTEAVVAKTGGKTAPAKSRTPTDPVEVDRTLCKACGICSSLCPRNVFDRDELGMPVVARPDQCTSCRLCELHCPDFAIAVTPKAERPPARESADEPAGVAPVEPAAAEPPAVAACDMSADQCGLHGEES